MNFNFKKCGNLVYIKKPEIEELNYIAELWSDCETMADVGGAVPLPIEKRKAWYERMVNPTDGKNFYCLIYTLDNVPVGEVSFHRFDKAEGKADFNVKVQSKYRSKGYAKEAIQLLLGYYFYDFGGQVIYDDVMNEKGQKALGNFGFDVVSKTYSQILFMMTKGRFEEILNNKGLQHEKSCGAVIYRNKDGHNEFLLIESKDNSYWGFPKGHVEEKESEIDTALREVYEETGLNIEIDERFRFETEYFVSIDILKKVAYFIGEAEDESVKIQTEEVQDYKWVQYSDALDLLTYESSNKLLKAVKEYLNCRA